MEKTKKIKIYLGLFYTFFVVVFLYLIFSKFSFQEITSYDFIKNNKWIKNILATDISVDGTLNGPNLDVYKNLLTYKNLNLIASGGIGSLDDINNLKSILCNECVVGKALYENKISLKELKNAN